MIFYVVKCRQGDDASVARRASAAEAVYVLEREASRGWAVSEITQNWLVIDESALRQAAELEMMAV